MQYLNVYLGCQALMLNYCNACDVLGRQLGRYTNWISNRPVSDANMCVALASQSSWQWAEEHCNSRYPYICETGLVSHLL